MAVLKRIVLKGFKSIREMDLELRPLNVLIGANGAGKSNLISFFQMVNDMMSRMLQSHINRAEGAQSLLHYGPEVTPQMDASLEFETENPLFRNCTYDFSLSPAPSDIPMWGDTLIFSSEALSFKSPRIGAVSQALSLGAGHEESHILEEESRGEPTATFFRQLVDRCRVYHFHDTRNVVIHQYHSEFFDPELKSDGSNLASFLYRLKSRDSMWPMNGSFARFASSRLLP